MTVVQNPTRYRDYVLHNPCPIAERLHRKQQLAAAFRLFGKLGFEMGLAGHITARDPQWPDKFWLNPLGLSFKQIKVSDLILCDSQGNIVEGKHGRLNLAAFQIHSHIHQTRPDVIAAAHAHSFYGKTWSTLGRLLDPITQDACAFYQDHALYSQYNGVAFESNEGLNIAKALGNSKAVILKNHGLLTVGGTVEEAAFWYISMEECCRSQLLAEAVSNRLDIIDHETALRTRNEATGFPVSGWASFKPYWQDITAEQPELLD